MANAGLGMTDRRQNSDHRASPDGFCRGTNALLPGDRQSLWFLSQLAVPAFAKGLDGSVLAVSVGLERATGVSTTDFTETRGEALFGAAGMGRLAAIETALLATLSSQSQKGGVPDIHDPLKVSIDTPSACGVVVVSYSALWSHDRPCMGVLGIIVPQGHPSLDVGQASKGEASPDQLTVSKQQEVWRQEEMARIRAQFLATVNHEIRTPMNALNGFLHLLAQSPLSGSQQALMRMISDASHALTMALRDILDVSAYEGGALVLTEVPLSLHDMGYRLRAALAPLTRNKGLSLHWHIDVDCPSWVQGDEVRLEQILLSLLDNAVKFTDQGSVALTIGVVEDRTDSITLRFTVRDTGIGLSQDQQASLYACFHQVDPSATRRYGGLGLGLALASRLVSMMGGGLSVSSRLGQGACFSFVLTLPKAMSPHGTPGPEVNRDPEQSVNGDGGAEINVPAELPPSGHGILDLDGALARADGQVELVIDLLDQFVETQGGVADELAALLDQGDLQQIEWIAHGLCGMAATLGAERLARSAEALMRMAHIRDGEGCYAFLVPVRRHVTAICQKIEEMRIDLLHRASCQEFADGSSHVLQALSGAFTWPEGGSRPDLQAVNDLMVILGSMLTTNDMAASEVFDRLKPALMVLCRDDRPRQLGMAIRRLDFEAGLKIWTHICSEAGLGTSRDSG